MAKWPSKALYATTLRRQDPWPSCGQPQSPCGDNWSLHEEECPYVALPPLPWHGLPVSMDSSTSSPALSISLMSSPGTSSEACISFSFPFFKTDRSRANPLPAARRRVPKKKRHKPRHHQNKHKRARELPHQNPKPALSFQGFSHKVKA